MEISNEYLSRIYRETQNSEGDSYATTWCEIADLDVETLTSWIASIPFSQDSALFEVYEGVSKSSSKPLTFFTSELERAFQSAAKEPNNRYIYAQLEAFAFLDRNTPAKIRSSICDLLIVGIQSAIPQIRRFSAYLLGDFLDAGDSSSAKCLRQVIENDPDWRVRLLAYGSLKDLCDELPNSEALPKLKLTDRLRASFTDLSRVHDYAA